MSVRGGGVADVALPELWLIWATRSESAELVADIKRWLWLQALAVPDMLESKRELTEALWKNVYNAEGDKAAAVLLQRCVVARSLTMLLPPHQTPRP